MIEQSHEFDQIAAALVKAQTMVRPAVKDGRNPHFKSEYATLESVWDAVRDALAANDLAVMQLPAQGSPDHCTISTMLVHASGQWIRSTASIPVAHRFAKDGRDLGTDAQSYGAAFSYGRRYGLAALLGVVSDDDDDGNAASHPSRHEGAGASYREPAPKPAPKKSNGKGERAPAVRATMIERITEMQKTLSETSIAYDELRQEIMGDTRVSDATDTKLEEYGKALKSLIAGKMA